MDIELTLAQQFEMQRVKLAIKGLTVELKLTNAKTIAKLLKVKHNVLNYFRTNSKGELSDSFKLSTDELFSLEVLYRDLTSWNENILDSYILNNFEKLCRIDNEINYYMKNKLVGE